MDDKDKISALQCQVDDLAGKLNRSPDWETFERMRGENKRLRRTLRFRHGCPLHRLYGDDGEMQCQSCRIDFKREQPIEIANKLYELAAEAALKGGE